MKDSKENIGGFRYHSCIIGNTDAKRRHRYNGEICSCPRGFMRGFHLYDMY